MLISKVDQLSALADHPPVARLNWTLSCILIFTTHSYQPSLPGFHLLVVVVEINDLRFNHGLLLTFDRSHALVVSTIVAITTGTRRRPTIGARCIAPATEKALCIIVGTTNAVFMRLIPQLKLAGLHISVSLLASNLRTYGVLDYTLKSANHKRYWSQRTYETAWPYLFEDRLQGYEQQRQDTGLTRGARASSDLLGCTSEQQRSLYCLRPRK